MRIIAFPHRPPKIGGPGSFQSRLESAIQQHSWRVVYSGEKTHPDFIFVVAGTAKIWWLLRCKIKGTKIVHRLDGVNWQHRIEWPGLRHWVRASLTNLLVRFIRRYFADFVIYQSKFVQDWWHREYGAVNKPFRIIYNGVNLKDFCPVKEQVASDGNSEVICVEGNVNGEPAIHILQSIKCWTTRVYGNVSKAYRDRLENSEFKNIYVMGPIPRTEIPKVLKGRKVFLNLETNPPCPNAVIEALASGIPVVGFDNGSLYELVGDEGGLLLPYNGNPWRLDVPDVRALETAIARIFDNYDYYSRGARTRAEQMFSLDVMVCEYIDAIESLRLI